MPQRISRRIFVGWVVRAATAAATVGLLPARTIVAAPAPPVADAGTAAPDGAVSVRLADLVLEGRGFWAGLADGVRFPSQGGDAWGLVAERPGGVYTSPALQADFACTHVGVHWRTDGGDESGLRVELRASRDGQTWMPWRRVARESHGPERPGNEAQPETFGALVHARLGTWLQTRLTFGQAGPETASIQALTLTCLDSRRGALTPHPPLPTVGEGETESLLPSPAAGGGAGGGGIPGLGSEVVLKAGPSSFLGRVVSREAWGADEALRFKDGVDQWPTAFVTPSLLVVHHTATEGDIGDAEADVRAIYAYHAVTQGWGDIGYNLLIDSSGQAYEGRRGREPDASGRREILSEGVVAGHALDYNYGSVGIALLGNYQERVPGKAMLDTLVDALAFMAQRYGIDVTATQDYVRARGDQTALWRDGMNNVSGHRDCLPTECPGDNVYSLLPSIRQRVDEQLGPRTATPVISLPRPVDRNLWPTDLGLTWSGDPATAGFRQRWAGWRRIPGSDKIEPLIGYDEEQRPVWSGWLREVARGVSFPPDAHGIYTLFIQGRDRDGREGRIVARKTFVVDRHVVVDDTDALRTRHDGSWERSRAILGYYGTGYQQAASGQDEASFRWQLAVPEPGTYAVQAVWTEAPDRTAEATYRVSQGGQALGEGTADQQEPGGKWVTVLKVPLAAGVPCTVELAGAEDGVVVADAIRLVLLA